MRRNKNGLVFVIGIIILVLVLSYAIATAWALTDDAEGANPSPHDPGLYQENDCAYCHLRGLTRAPIMPQPPHNPDMTTCLACHSQ